MHATVHASCGMSLTMAPTPQRVSRQHMPHPCSLMLVVQAADTSCCACCLWCIPVVYRLIELCEARLMSELLSMPASAAAAEAPHLVSLADELGLVQLRRAAVAFIAQHYTEVKVSNTVPSPCTAPDGYIRKCCCLTLACTARGRSAVCTTACMRLAAALLNRR
jgi:hypothetical protein